MISREEILTKINTNISMCSILGCFQEIEELNSSCKSILLNSYGNKICYDETIIIKIQAVIDYVYEQINIGNWKEVKLFFRKTITLASYIKLFASVHLAKSIDSKFIQESFKVIDFGIVFGCPLDGDPNLLQKCATLFNSIHTVVSEIPEAQEITTDNSFEAENVDLISLETNTIEVIDCPSMEHFYRNCIQQNKPMILSNCINHWPALTKWKNPNYFKKLAGSRTVPIELGKIYTDQNWTQKLMTLGEFIDNHIYQSTGPTGYLAQYQLFNQIPELRKDIIEPDYCCFSDDEPVDVMAWFGPKGTLSALHHDPKTNLLAQVVGSKQIFLFSPEDSEYLYPYSDELLNNTAQVDPRKPDMEKFPKYKDAKVYHCILRPGQMLYIPKKWWHFVESLSVSFSVSFWWNIGSLPSDK